MDKRELDRMRNILMEFVAIKINALMGMDLFDYHLSAERVMDHTDIPGF